MANEDAPLRLNSAEAADTAPFRKADLSSIKADPDSFYEFGYRSVIDQMIARVVETEAPVRADVVAHIRSDLELNRATRFLLNDHSARADRRSTH
ncbi:DUF3320 domain-containing protein [Devosia sp.]|uniref:DUF3320 domain-containing protein n=1 Tax=Devosia sp. TaxID=1871048 RepID=UPI00352519D4